MEYDLFNVISFASGVSRVGPSQRNTIFSVRSVLIHSSARLSCWVQYCSVWAQNHFLLHEAARAREALSYSPEAEDEPNEEVFLSGNKK